MVERTPVFAVCGHEAGRGAALRGQVGPDVHVVTCGRGLYRALSARAAGRPAAVVPMTLGREPGLAAEIARTVRALPGGSRAGVAVAEAFGTSGHLTGWLRAAANDLPREAALLVAAPSGDPFEDAELYRVAHLVRRHGRHRLVEVALTGGVPDLAEGVRRCAALGARSVAVLAASFVVPVAPVTPDGVPVLHAGPLLGPAALGALLRARAAVALHRLREHGDDGVLHALAAADGHGLHHTHGVGDEGRPHGHGPGGGHSHERLPSVPHTPRSPSPHSRPAFPSGARSTP